MADKEKIKAFLIEYDALCKKHNMYVGGCGCCGSPFVSDGIPDILHHVVDEELADEEILVKMANNPDVEDKYDLNYLTDEQKNEIVKNILYANIC